MIKNIIFDLDGTLADTSEDIIFSLNYALKKFGILKKVNFTSFKKVANRGSFLMIKKITKKNDLINYKINDYFLRHYRKNICNKTKLKKNILNLLKQAKKRKINLYVSTNKKEVNAILILKKLKIFKFFKFIAGHDTFKNQKPCPLHLESLKKKFKLKKKQTVFIGDTEIDSELAYKFNIKFILIKKGYTNLKISQIKHDFSIMDYSNLPRIFKVLSKFNT